MPGDKFFFEFWGIMIEVPCAAILVNRVRLGYVDVLYHELLIRCDICLFEDKKLWIKMPEKWIKGRKYRFVYWPTKEKSDEVQQIVLNKVFDMLGLDLPLAIQLRDNWKAKKEKDSKE